MDKINILHILQNTNVGGVQQQLLSLLRAYDREVINPTVCCFKPLGDIGRQMEKSGVEVVAFGSERHYRFSPGIVRGLYRVMKERNIHVVRAHKYSASLYGRIAAWLARVPVVITSVHGNYHKDLRFERKIANRSLSRVTDRIVAMSESIRADIIKNDRIDPAKILVIRNGVDTSLFSPVATFHNVRGDFRVKDDDMLIGFVGRLVPAKGLEYLLDALAGVRREFANVKLLVVGKGQLLDTLKDRAIEKGLQGHIFFAGERRDIVDILASIDIFIIPSVAEGLPNALLEAMSMAKPVIVTKAGGMPEIIKDGTNGLVVPVGDASALDGAIRKLMGDRDMAKGMGGAAREFIEKSFSIKAVARIWQDLYLSLLQQKGVL